MTHYEMIVGYLTALAGRFRDDERGFGVVEWLVLTGIALVSAAGIAVILWGKLKDGAEGIELPTPAAP